MFDEDQLGHIQYALLDSDRKALEHQVGKTPLREIPMLQDDLLQLKSKPLAEGSIMFDRQSLREGKRRKQNTLISPRQELEILEKKKKIEEEDFAVKQNLYNKKDIPGNFSHLGHARDLSKNFIDFGDGPPNSDDLDAMLSEIYQKVHKPARPDELKDVPSIFGKPSES